MASWWIDSVTKKSKKKRTEKFGVVSGLLFCQRAVVTCLTTTTKSYISEKMITQLLCFSLKSRPRHSGHTDRREHAPDQINGICVPIEQALPPRKKLHLWAIKKIGTFQLSLSVKSHCLQSSVYCLGLKAVSKTLHNKCFIF